MMNIRRRDLITSALAAATFGVGVASTWVSSRADQPPAKPAPLAKKPKPKLIALDPAMRD